MEIVDFEWWRHSDGYELDSAPTPPPRRRPRWWPKRMVDVRPQYERTFERYRHYAIRSKSGRLEPYRPLNEFPALFDIFSRKPRTPKGMLDFCNKFGLLEGHYRNVTGKLINVATACNPMLYHHSLMHEAVLAFELKQVDKAITLCNSYSLAKGAIRLHRNSNGAISIALLPENLIQAMWIQLALHIASGTRLLQCEHCSTPFIVGTGTGRRNTAKYCSNACKLAAFKKRHELIFG
jgi:hypothetical protein